MNTYLWKLNEEKLNKTNLFLYSSFIKQNFNIDAEKDFNKIWKWSIEKPRDFWKSIWDFTQVKGSLGNILLQESEIFYENKFFPDSKLNYTENLLKKNDTNPAIIFKELIEFFHARMYFKVFTCGEFSGLGILHWVEINAKIFKEKFPKSF